MESEGEEPQALDASHEDKLPKLPDSVDGGLNESVFVGDEPLLMSFIRLRLKLRLTLSEPSVTDPRGRSAQPTAELKILFSGMCKHSVTGDKSRAVSDSMDSVR